MINEIPNLSAGGCPEQGYLIGIITDAAPDACDEAGFVHGVELTVDLGTQKVMCVGAHAWTVAKKIRKDNISKLLGSHVRLRLSITSLTRGPRSIGECHPSFTQTRGYDARVSGKVLEIRQDFVLVDCGLPIWLRALPLTPSVGDCLEDEGIVNIREISLTEVIGQEFGPSEEGMHNQAL